MTHKYIFAFENEKSIIIELKRKDMPEGSSPEELYYWLFIDKFNSKCNRLNFVSMEKDPAQIRIFKECLLRFDDRKAILENYEKQKEIIYDKIDTSNIEENIFKIIDLFLKSN